MTQRNNDIDKQIGQASQLLALRYGDALKPGEALYCKLGEYEGLNRLTLHLVDKQKDRDFRFHVDFSGSVETGDGSAALLDALDFLDGVLAEYLKENREAWPNLDPVPYTFEGRQMWLCGGMHRPKAEAEAERLLAGDVCDK